MRQHGSVAHGMSELRILQIAAGPDGRGQIMEGAALSAPKYLGHDGAYPSSSIFGFAISA